MFYTVLQGESLSTIAQKFGFRSYRLVYNDSRNTAFRKIRPNPNLIFPGDQVWIPDKLEKKAPCVTTKTHTFVVRVPKRSLKMRVLDVDGEPLAGAPYELLLDGKPYSSKKTDGSGYLNEDIPFDAREGQLRVDQHIWPLKLDHLNPVRNTHDDGISGIQARLRNLGYRHGEIDGVLGPLTRSALQAFQDDHGLDATGEPDDATIAKLTEAHGS